MVDAIFECEVNSSGPESLVLLVTSYPHSYGNLYTQPADRGYMPRDLGAALACTPSRPSLTPTEGRAITRKAVIACAGPLDGDTSARLDALRIDPRWSSDSREAVIGPRSSETPARPSAAGQ